MKDKVVLVTGANGGLGKCVTESLLEAGAIVAGVSRKIQQSDFPNTRFDPFPGDLSSGEGADKIVQNVVARFGRVDVVVHTVGGFAGGKTISETDPSAADYIVNWLFFSLVSLLPLRRRSRIQAVHRRPVNL